MSDVGVDSKSFDEKPGIVRLGRDNWDASFKPNGIVNEVAIEEVGLDEGRG